MKWKRKKKKTPKQPQLQWINQRNFSSIYCTHNAGNSIFALWNTGSFSRPFCDIWFLFFLRGRLEFALGTTVIVGATWNVLHFMLIVGKDIFTWVCVCSARSWKQTEKRGKMGSQGRNRNGSWQRNIPWPQASSLEMLGGAKRRLIIYKDEEFASPAPKFPTWWGIQPQTELYATKKIKILASPLYFYLHGLVCFTQQIGLKGFPKAWQPKLIVVLNWRWKGIGFRGNVGRLWMWVIYKCLSLKLRGEGITALNSCIRNTEI